MTERGDPKTSAGVIQAPSSLKYSVFVAVLPGFFEIQQPSNIQDRLPDFWLATKLVDTAATNFSRVPGSKRPDSTGFTVVATATWFGHN